LKQTSNAPLSLILNHVAQCWNYFKLKEHKI
jgi:hypothetical protein